MDTLTMIGLGMAFTLGTFFGTCLMYFGGLIIEWKIDRQFEKQEERA